MTRANDFLLFHCIIRKDVNETTDLEQNTEPSGSPDILKGRSEPAAIAPKSNYRNVALLRSKQPDRASVGLAQAAGLSQKGPLKEKAASECDGFCKAGSTDQYLQFVWVWVSTAFFLFQPLL